MKVFNNVSIVDSIDSFCSTIGNELAYEKEGKTNILLPCFNIGFYENDINPSSITKAIDICYFLFENVSKCEIDLSTYKSLFPDEGGVIGFDGNEFKYRFDFGTQSEDATAYELAGVCFRVNSFSYGKYKIYGKSMRVILLDESDFLEEYNSNDSFKDNFVYHSFLRNENKKYIDSIIKAV
jgi:hypothetical protein